MSDLCFTDEEKLNEYLGLFPGEDTEGEDDDEGEVMDVDDDPRPGTSGYQQQHQLTPEE